MGSIVYAGRELEHIPDRAVVDILAMDRVAAERGRHLLLVTPSGDLIVLGPGIAIMGRTAMNYGSASEAVAEALPRVTAEFESKTAGEPIQIQAKSQTDAPA